MLNVKGKLEVARLLEQPGIDVIEASQRADRHLEYGQYYAEDVGVCPPSLFLLASGRCDCRDGLMLDLPNAAGYITPYEGGQLISSVLEHVPNILKATISVQYRDDLELAVANALSGV